MPVETVGENVRVRMRAPGDFEEGSLRTITLSAGQGIKAVVGRPKGEKTTVIQSYMFDKKRWDEDRAKKWVEGHKKELEDEAAEKAMSLSDIERQVGGAWYEKWNPGRDQEQVGWPRDIYFDRVIVSNGDGMSAYPYTRNGDEFVWGEPYQVTLEYLPVETTNGILGPSPNKQQPLIERLAGVFKSWLEGNVQTSSPELVIEPEPEAEPSAPTNAFTIWKEADRYRWLAVFSNRYRDNDNPREILSQAAHKDYVKAVDSGEWPKPQLWHWHTPGTAWGQADWVAYDEEKGFTLASGWVKRGHEKEAEALAAMTQPIGVSHGMIGKSIQRDVDDPTVITQYRTFEVSDLPAWAAANPLTGFTILQQEESMSIPKEKKDYLASVGLTGEQIDAIETQVGALSKEAQEAGLEFKETPAEVIATVTEPEAAPQPEATPEAPMAAVLTKEEVAEAIVAATLPLRQMVEEMQAKITAMAATDEAKVADKAASTPAMSLSELVGARMRAVGSRDTLIDGRGALAKDGPKETEIPKSRIGIPFIDRLVAES